MNLPEYFLADLPPGTLPSPAMVTEACQTLKSNRRSFLAHRSTDDLVGVLDAVARDWLEPDNPFRQRALDLGPGATGFSRETIAAGLDAYFAALDSEALHSLIVQDLGQVHRLDRLTTGEGEARSRRLAIARGPEILAHIAAGNLPVPALASLTLGILTRSAQFMKCASGASLIPRLFAHSIYEREPKLGACIEIAEWTGGNRALEAALLDQADRLTFTGADTTLADLRPRLPTGLRCVAYGHRVSFAYVTLEHLANYHLPQTLAAAVDDVAAWDQQGCLSPHVLYVESGGRNPPDRFAELLAQALDACEQRQPRGQVDTAAAAAIASRRAVHELRAAHSPDTQVWVSPNSTAWTVVFEGDPVFRLSCLNRFVYVKPVANLEEALRAAEAIRTHVSTVGLAATAAREPHLALQLAQWGVPRVCPLGRMQKPPIAWRHDGRPALGDLVTWTDWECAAR
jgi:hypothetical protein